MEETLKLCQQLIARPSISPEDAGCQEILRDSLEKMGFVTESFFFQGVRSLWAIRGEGAPVILLSGHTDVVPPDPLKDWQSPPFEPVVEGEWLRGRGASDMKGGIASQVIGCQRFLAEHPDFSGTIALLFTSDEEVGGAKGAAHVADLLYARGQRVDYALIGEPSSEERLGDAIKIGRRGSLNGKLTLSGVGGHVAYPDQIRNPVHLLGGILTTLAEQSWDRETLFPATSLQISGVETGSKATNVAPSSLEMSFNFRFSPESTPQELQNRVAKLVEEGINRSKDPKAYSYQLDWTLQAEPFYTAPAELTEKVSRGIEKIVGGRPHFSTAGGASDGRFLMKLGAQVVEVGHVNKTIHQANERIRVADLDLLSEIYRQILQELLT